MGGTVEQMALFAGQGRPKAELNVAETPGGEPGPAGAGPGQGDLFGATVAGDDALQDLAARTRACRRCGLREGCRGVVFGEGDPDSGVLLLGEGPGSVEDELGRPFVGPAGQLLDKILEAVGFRREEVYISNTVLCRPPGNRAPHPDEVAACRLWLDERLAIMRPSIIVCLGGSAGRALLGPEFRITRDRGRWYAFGSAAMIPTFHPAALLRDPAKKRPVWEDMKLVRAEWLRRRSGEAPDCDGGPGEVHARDESGPTPALPANPADQP
jgi:uracil-DNA glycosylase family 4